MKASSSSVWPTSFQHSSSGVLPARSTVFHLGAADGSKLLASTSDDQESSAGCSLVDTNSLFASDRDKSSLHIQVANTQCSGSLYNMRSFHSAFSTLQ
jgi:hypothetical protein